MNPPGASSGRSCLVGVVSLLVGLCLLGGVAGVLSQLLPRGRPLVPAPATIEAPQASTGLSHPGPVTPTPPSLASSPLPTTTGPLHVVRSGETLESIAQQYSISSQELAAANALTVPTPLEAGQTLHLPPSASLVAPTATPGAPAAEQAPSASGVPTRPSGLVSAQVVRVVDGDTVDVTIDGQTVRLRLIGMDTPETVDPRSPVQCFGREASAQAHTLLDGQTVQLEADPSQGEHDIYDRVLRYIWLPDGRLFNLEMIAQGYAHEYTYRVPYRYQALFQAAEAEARAQERGLWSPDTCRGDTEQAASEGSPSATAVPLPPTWTAIPVLPPTWTPIATPVPLPPTWTGLPILPPTWTPVPLPPTAPPIPSSCDPSYPDVCIPPESQVGDLNCGDIAHRRFRVLPPDPHGFDGDNDGVGCES